MSFERRKSLPLRAADLAYDDRGPGLYPNEGVVVLDTGYLVAVGMERRQTASNAGLELYAWARWIDPDGSTVLTASGHHAEVEHRHVADVGWYDAHGGADAVSRALMLAMLGESFDRDAMPLDDALRASMNIREAIAATLLERAPDPLELIAPQTKEKLT